MSFATPIFALAGLLAVAIPIVIHLLNRRRYKIVEWAAMRYLLEAIKQNRRRMRLESLLILLLRCLAVALLGFALARPMACNRQSLEAIGATRIGLHVIIIDDSLSMRLAEKNGDRLSTAKNTARKIAEQLAARGQEISVLALSPPRVLIEPTYDLDAVLAAIDSVSPTFLADDAAGAFEAISKTFESRPDQTLRRIHWVGDFAAGSFEESRLASLAQSAAAVGSSETLIYLVGSADAANAAVVAARASDPLVRVGFNAEWLAAVEGFGSNAARQITWKAGRESAPPRTIEPTSNATPTLLGPLPVSSKQHLAIETRISPPDALPEDDVRFSVVEVAGEVNVLLVEGWRDGLSPLRGAGGFIRLALAPPDQTITSDRRAGYVKLDVIDPTQLPTHPTTGVRAIILASVESIDSATAGRLAEFVSQGNSLLIAAGPRIDAQQYNRSLGVVGLLPGVIGSRVESADGSATFTFDPQRPHPMLAAFRNYERSGLESASVFSHWQLQLDPAGSAERVLNVSTNTGEIEPAITLHRLGSGRVIFVATSFDVEGTTLVARPAFVTLLHELLANSIGQAGLWRTLDAGDSLTLPKSIEVLTTPVLSDPDGQRVEMFADSETNQWRSVPMIRPGLYSLRAGEFVTPIAVNVPTSESDVRSLSIDQLRDLLPAMNLQPGAISADDSTFADAGGNDLSWPLLVVLLAVIGVESLLAMRFGRARGRSAT